MPITDFESTRGGEAGHSDLLFNDVEWLQFTLIRKCSVQLQWPDLFISLWQKVPSRCTDFRFGLKWNNRVWRHNKLLTGSLDMLLEFILYTYVYSWSFLHFHVVCSATTTIETK